MNRIIFFFAISSLLLIGCMDTYYLKDYKSPKEFYDFVNQKADDRSIDIEMKNGKNYETDILKIKNDSTFINQPITKIKEGNQTSFSRSEIKNIEYKKFNPSGTGNTAEITFTSGKKILVQDLMSNKDSIFINSQVPIVYLTNEMVPIPTSEIKMISYNNRLKGMAEYIGIGFIVGLLVGIENDANLPPLPYMGGGAEPGLGTVFLAVLGALGGTLIGPAVGSTQEYMFVDDPISKGWSAIGIIGGIGINGINSSLDNNTNYTKGGIVKYIYGGFVVWSFNKNISIRAEILRSTKGGSYQTYYTNNYYNVSYISTVYLNFLEVPVLFQYTFPKIYFHPRFYAGPALSIFNDGKIDRVPGDHSYPDNSFRYERDVTTDEINSPDVDIILGGGINLNRHVTIDVRYDLGFSSLSSKLFDGQAANLKQNAVSIIMGYEF